MLKKLFIFSMILFTLPFNILYAYAGDEDSLENSDNKEKIVYLTFDDAPSKTVFKDILDILKKEDVRATFFVIGNQVKGNEEILKRAYDEGNSIGLHSFTHEKKNLYTSNEKFLDEMLTTQKAIEDVIGCSPKILRFPFGANNSFYKLKKDLVKLLHDNDLRIYDWNADSGDGLNPHLSPSRILKNSKSDKDTVVLLMHASPLHKNTAKALPDIIAYYKANGYTFKTIDCKTPEVFKYIK